MTYYSEYFLDCKRENKINLKGEWKLDKLDNCTVLKFFL